MTSFDDQLAAVGAVIGASAFFVGFGSIRIQTQIQRAEARLSETQTRLELAASRDDAFPLPWELQRLERAAGSRLAADSQFAKLSAVIVTLFSVLVVVLFSLPTTGQVSDGMQALKFILMFVALLLSLAAWFEMFTAKHLPRQLIAESAQGKWALLSACLDRGSYSEAIAHADEVLDLMPGWPWAEVVRAIALAPNADTSAIQDEGQRLRIRLYPTNGSSLIDRLRTSSAQELLLEREVRLLCGHGIEVEAVGERLSSVPMSSECRQLDEQLRAWRRRAEEQA